MMIKKTTTIPLAALFLCLFCVIALAGNLHDEWKDSDGDGRKETHIFYDGDQITEIQIDKNGDGKPDQWIHFKNGKKFTAEIDTNFDGKVDKWLIYDAEEKVKYVAKDTNHDGKPDQWTNMLKGRNLILKESDRNFDGKIDQRTLLQWNQDKKLPVVNNGRVSYVPNPGYTWIWKEEDNNFDGKIDAYLVRGNNNPPKDRIGQEMNPLPTRSEEQNNPDDKNKEKTPSRTQRLVDNLNEKYGLK